MAYREQSNGSAVHSQGYRSVHDRSVSIYGAPEKKVQAYKDCILAYITPDEFIKWFEATFEVNGKTVEDFSWDEIVNEFRNKYDQLRIESYKKAEEQNV